LGDWFSVFEKFRNLKALDTRGERVKSAFDSWKQMDAEAAAFSELKKN
jgi:hypothetical protein